MYKEGHLWFALLIEGFALYVLNDFVSLPYNFIALHSIFYIMGSTMILDYGFFDSYKKGWGHHGFWHSRRFLWILILILIPPSVHFYLTHPKYLIFSMPFNVGSIAGAIFLGVIVHLFGDSFCSRLRR